MQKTIFQIQKMDCAAEEQLIRLQLEGLETIARLQFDLDQRRLDVYHSGDPAPIFDKINALQLDAALVETVAADEAALTGSETRERKLLWQVLAINLFFFVLEILTGFFSNSMGLVADSLDMLADSVVYGLALFAVGGTLLQKKNVAKASGYFQMVLAVIGISEVVRRFLGYGEVPTFQLMIVISTLALIGNATSLVLLRKSSPSGAHMRASLIFTSNDVIINLGVIMAGVLVFISGSKLPDLLIGAVVFLIVARGAYRILQIAK